jgi:hypothetical protein
MPSRWDYLYDLKPVPIQEHLIEELGRLLAEDLAQWPLRIEQWSSPEEAARFARLLAPGSVRPDPKVYAEAFRLARLELTREFDSIDDYMRNERWRQFTPSGDGFDALILLWRYLNEAALAILEATRGRLKRAQMADCLLRAERRM